MGTQAQRIQAVEKIMQQACSMTNQGGYTVLSSTIDYFKNMLKPSSASAMTVNPNIFIFDDEQVKYFIALGITLEDLILIEKRHEIARELIRDSMILMYENTRKKIQGWQARNLLLDIARGYSVKTDALSPAEMNHIRAGNMTCIDTSWVLNVMNVDGQEILVKDTNLSVRGAFDFYDTLSHPEKRDLNKVIYAAKAFIKADILELEKMHLPIDAEIDEIEQIFNALPSSYKRLNSTTISARTSQHFIKICLTNSLKEELQLNAIRRLLYQLFSQVLNTASAQPIDLFRNIRLDFQSWVGCKFANYCPSEIPLPYLLHTILPRPVTNMSQLASEIFDTTFNRLYVNEIPNFVNNLWFSPEFPLHFKDIMANITDKNASRAFFTEDFKAGLRNELTYEVTHYEMHQELVGFTRDTLFKPLNISRQLTHAFQTFVGCYFVNNTAALTTSACNATWNVLESLAATTQPVLEQLQAPTFLKAVTEVPQSSSDIPYVKEILGVGLIVSVGFFAANLLKRKKPKYEKALFASERKKLAYP